MVQHIPAPGAALRLWPALLSPEESERWLERLLAELPWVQGVVRLFGREVAEPRLSCWLGDPGCAYTYSGQTRRPVPWTPGVSELKALVERACGARFNSALANLYRGGADGMGWHADDEPELGEQPVIASLSLGATRRFLLKRRDDASVQRELALAGGSLLVMSGRTQALWKHRVPKTRRPVGARINLTFRQIRGADGV